MNKIGKWLILLGLVLGCAFVVKSESGYFKLAYAQVSSYRGWPFPQPVYQYKPPCENFWVINSVGEDIAQILRFAKGDKNPVSKLDVETTQKDVTKFHLLFKAHGSAQFDYDLDLQHHIWAPENYTPWVTGLMKAWSIDASGAPHPDNVKLPALLTDASSATIIAQGKRISDSLNGPPLDPELHQEAALVLGAFALKEAAGSFADIRQTLSRISSHLAIAAALRPNGVYGKNGEIASLVLLALVGRTSDVVDGLAVHPIGMPAWENVLKLRATHDWRILPNPAAASLLERLEYARALDVTLGQQALLNFLSKTTNPPIVDWTRILFERSFSVEAGHVLSNVSMKQELDDLGANWKLFNGTKLSSEKMTEALNEPVAGPVQENLDGPKIAVFTWGDFGAFHQRHIMQSCARTDYFLVHMLGVPDDAAQLQSYVAQYFSRLTLYPILQLRFARTADTYAAAMKQATKLWDDHPELVTADNANLMTEPRGNVPGIINIFLENRILFGTTYDFENRVTKPGDIDNALVSWDEPKKANPYDCNVLEGWMWNKYHGRCTAQQTEENFLPIIDYDINATLYVANAFRNDEQTYVTMLNHACAWNPNLYFMLGDYFRDRDMSQQAADAYQRGIDLAPDRVSMSNNCQWLANYYFDIGRQDLALKVANGAADVYSEGGLETLGWLLERMGRWKDAEDCYQKIAERYNFTQDLNEFYIRNRDRDERYAREYKTQLDKVFPNGMERDNIADFRTPPVDGAVVARGNDLTRRYNLDTGAVFVSVDGYRIHTTDQYLFIRSLTLDPNIDLVVWVGNRYQEIAANLPMRKFECSIATYKPPLPGQLYGQNNQN